MILFRGVAAEVLFLDGLALVVFLFAPGEGDVELGVAAFGDEETAGDYCQALFLDGTGELAEFLAGEQQLAVALGIVAVEGAPPVFGYVHILHVQLTAGEIAPAVH